MLGQGIGPLGGPALRRRAAAVLPGVELIALREGLAGPGLLRDLGVAAERVVVTGDDAIELAYARGPADAGEDVGVNIRVSGNSGVESAAVAGLASAVRSFLERRRVGMVPVPIARGQAHDAVVLEDFARTVGAPLCGTLDPATPGAVVQQLGRCRILVTGAYHAAVFALSRGIPVVCLSNSEYYHHKFDGLAAQFGTGCWQVRLDGSAAEHLTSAMESAWRDAPSLREPLRRAAAAQVALGREAYQRLERLAPTAGARTMNRVPA
jgi:polysaccharide pyruvyl transferase WcaK-like protein